MFRTVGPTPTQAELDELMLEDLRAWRRARPDEVIHERGANLTGAELDLLLRIADERDDLKAADAAEHGESGTTAYEVSCRHCGAPEREHGNNPAVGHHPYEPEPEPDVETETASWRRARRVPFAATACRHSTGHVAGGALVCSSCGLLLAWISREIGPRG